MLLGITFYKLNESSRDFDTNLFGKTSKQVVPGGYGTARP